MTTCPFCGHDPYHYVDNGIGMEAVAVNCCELGVELFSRGPKETVSLSWDEFLEIAGKLTAARYEPSDAEWKRAVDTAAQQFESYMRQGVVKTATERRNALDDAFQHAYGMIRALSQQQDGK